MYFNIYYEMIRSVIFLKITDKVRRHFYNNNKHVTEIVTGTFLEIYV